MLGNIGISEFLLIAVIALLLFGPSKLPELGRALGKTIREFKQGTRELLGDDPEPAPRKDVTPQEPPAPVPNQAPVQTPAGTSASPEASSSAQTAPPQAGSSADSRTDNRRLPD
ncbi:MULTISPECIES: twin-arginine translocase TatA/TatE family subunit [Paenibacillus]|uniref:twin-arginine translocase TatA/TatE family subunit n=1 Tax=Paenibacillus TaxID=44249 RepID=UPI0029E7FD0D|nr:twin-arginine translocase TatA/TatE family subunit [Paenibacillus caseinilyticus]